MEADLFRMLQGSYNPNFRPLKNSSLPIKVEFGVNALKVLNVDLDNGVMESFLWLKVKWTDEYFKWDPAEWGGITTLRLLRSRCLRCLTVASVKTGWLTV